MITYTGTIAFSAPEILSHTEYKFKLKIKNIIVNQLICDLQEQYFIVCFVENSHFKLNSFNFIYKQKFNFIFSLDDLIKVIIEGKVSFEDQI